jgi:hypothetical protein
MGPSLAGIAITADQRTIGLTGRDYIEQSILAPSANLVEGFEDLMPQTFGQILTPDELDALISFLYVLE